MRKYHHKSQPLFPVWAIACYPLALACLLLGAFPGFVETYYVPLFYLPFARCLRMVFGVFPFSVGDLAYPIFGGWVLYRMYGAVGRICNKGWDGRSFLMGCARSAGVVAWLYVFFMVFWGLNYHRLGTPKVFGIEGDRYTKEQLQAFTCELASSLNEARRKVGEGPFPELSKRWLFDNARSAYQTASTPFPVLRLGKQSIKTSLFGRLIGLAGYSGYYNPFTGEAQVVGDLPAFLLPFVACHETAHQLGFADEGEANFVGFLAALRHGPVFRYSALFELFSIANHELMQIDPQLAILNLRSLEKDVKKDRKTYWEYLTRNENKVEPALKNVYDRYLRANGLSNGIESYSEVVGWALSYRRKYGEDSLE